MMQRVNLAFETLGDPLRRVTYDHARRSTRAGSKSYDTHEKEPQSTTSSGRPRPAPSPTDAVAKHNRRYVAIGMIVLIVVGLLVLNSLLDNASGGAAQPAAAPGDKPSTPLASAFLPTRTRTPTPRAVSRVVNFLSPTATPSKSQFQRTLEALSRSVAAPTPTPIPTTAPPPTPTYTPTPTHFPTPVPTATVTPLLQWTAYQNTHYHYQIDVAPGWTVNQPQEDAVYIRFATWPYDARIVIFSSVDAVGTVEQWADELLTYRASVNTLFEFISISNVQLAPDLAGIRLEYLAQAEPKDCVASTLELIAIAGSTEYELLGLACQDSLAFYKRDMERMIDSFVVLAPMPTPTPPTPTPLPPPTPTQAEQLRLDSHRPIELEQVRAAVLRMMAANNISMLPNPVFGPSEWSAACTIGTHDMSKFPDVGTRLRQ